MVLKHWPCHERERGPQHDCEHLETPCTALRCFVILQQHFYDRKPQEGESLRQFSYALMSLMEPVLDKNPDGVPNSETVLWNQFLEHEIDGMLRQQLKEVVRQKTRMPLIDVREEAIMWGEEGVLPLAMVQCQSS